MKSRIPIMKNLLRFSQINVFSYAGLENIYIFFHKLELTYILTCMTVDNQLRSETCGLPV